MAEPSLSGMLGTEAIELCMQVRDNADARAVKQAAVDAIDPKMQEIINLFTPIAAEYEASRLALINKMRAAGVDIPTTARLSEVVEKLNEYTVLLQSGTVFTDDVTTLGDALFAKNNLIRVKSNTQQSDYAGLFTAETANNTIEAV